MSHGDAVRPGAASTPKRDHPVITTARLIQIAFIVFIVIFVLRIFPFGISPFFGVVFALIILTNVMKIAARAGGRKTTRMHDPNKRNPRRH